MDINRGNMNALFTGYNMAFQEGVEASDQSYKRFTTVLPSQNAVEVFPFLEKFGGMREWIGDRYIKSIASKKMQVANREFEDTVGVKRADIEDDNYGLYNPLLEDLGMNSEDLWRELAEEAFLGGFDDEWIDDLPFYSDTRKYGDQTICNLGTAALSDTAYNAALNAMYLYKGHNGKSLKIKPDLMLIGPTNRGVAFDILKNELIIKTKGANAGVVKNQNAFEGTVDYQVVDDLGSRWALTYTKRTLKGVAVLQRIKAKLTRKDRDEDNNVFDRSEYVYGTRARGAGFLTLPHLTYASDPS